MDFFKINLLINGCGMFSWQDGGVESYYNRVFFSHELDNAYKFCINYLNLIRRTYSLNKDFISSRPKMKKQTVEYELDLMIRELNLSMNDKFDCFYTSRMIHGMSFKCEIIKMVKDVWID